jgi:hypothetical protein
LFPIGLEVKVTDFAPRIDPWHTLEEPWNAYACLPGGFNALHAGG